MVICPVVTVVMLESRLTSCVHCVGRLLCLEAVTKNLHETYQCRMYNRKLLMMGREDARNL